MKLDVVVYNIHSPYIFVDCNEQEVYGKMLYSIETLRKYSDIPVLIFSNSRFPLEEFQYMQKHTITKKFKNIEIRQYDKESVDQETIISYCVEHTFDNYNYSSLMYISCHSIFDCDPVEIFSDVEKQSIYRGREPFTECNFLMLSREKSEKFLNGVNLGYKTVPTETLKINVDADSVKHSNLECELPSKIVVYQKGQTEYFVPSQYWNCSVIDRVKAKQNIICHNCCRIIKSPIIPEIIIYD